MTKSKQPAAACDQAKSPPRSEVAPLVWDAQQLLRGQREVWIEHGGVRYRLRLTRRNKLILQK